MTALTKIPSRHPVVPTRRLALSEERHTLQRQRGLYTTERGEALAIPVDRLSEPTVFLNRELWRKGPQGVYRPGVKFAPTQFTFQRKALTWLREHVDQRIPYWYYLATLGHDLHVSTRGDLYAKHWHRGWANPFDGSMEESLDPTFKALRDTHPDWSVPYGALGFTENLGWLSGAKVTDAFVNVQVGAMVAAGGGGQHDEFNDFNEHEVGTSNTAENNDQTTLVATSGIALQAGTQVDDGGDPPTMTTVATITADATETWEEHGVFSTGTDTLLDRSLTSGQSVTSSDTVEYTYVLTVNPEA